jgi:hypothetical protein
MKPVKESIDRFDSTAYFSAVNWPFYFVKVFDRDYPSLMAENRRPATWQTTWQTTRGIHMFKHLVSFFVTLVCLNSVAETNINKGFKVETHFDYSNNGKKIASKNSFILAEDNKTWNTLAEPKNGVALLGRIVKSDKTTLQLEYIVVDTTKNNAVISTPAIIAKWGKKAELTIEAGAETVAISLLATPTEYSIEK